MAASRQSLSPTANLLRNSRLFSLPTPLPRPALNDTSSAGINKSSDTATLPYPTHQAIATTKSSLARGDWGLKRPLPARSHLVQVSDPVLRISQLDTIEHITDFDSAADHVRTREKFQEMGVPMMQGLANLRDYDISSVKPRGAFERRDDTTSYSSFTGVDEASLFLQSLRRTIKGTGHKAVSNFTPLKRSEFKPKTHAEIHNAKRWKHEGPWIPGMSAEDFVDYLSKEISKRRDEFNAYLVSYVKNNIYKTRKNKASEDIPPVDIEEAKIWQEERESRFLDISDTEVTAKIMSLREKAAASPLESELFTDLIIPFLRLPPIKFKNNYDLDSKKGSERYKFDQDIAPLSTHPSAGLGYLRTKSYVTNHPILGPQATPSPITARVVQARQTAGNKEDYARLGVAGFIANDQYRSTDPGARGQGKASDVETIDVDTPGGCKVLVQPQYGSVTVGGRIVLKISRSNGPEGKIARGELYDKAPYRPNAESRSTSYFSKDMGKSGLKELDDKSEQAQQFTEFMSSVQSRQRGKPGPGFPGIADALRSS